MAGRIPIQEVLPPSAAQYRMTLRGRDTKKSVFPVVIFYTLMGYTLNIHKDRFLVTVGNNSFLYPLSILDWVRKSSCTQMTGRLDSFGWKSAGSSLSPFRSFVSSISASLFSKERTLGRKGAKPIKTPKDRVTDVDNILYWNPRDRIQGTRRRRASPLTFEDRKPAI